LSYAFAINAINVIGRIWIYTIPKIMRKKESASPPVIGE
jgi:hypothetical protein